MVKFEQLPQAKRWQDLSKAEQQQIASHLQAVARNESVKPAKPNKGTFQLRGYVRCELAAADKEAFLTWEASWDGGQLYDALVKLCDSGYLFKVGESKDGHQASLCAASTGYSWDGYVLTAFAGNSARAIALLIYKHGVLMQNDWSAWVEEGGEDFFR